MASIEIKDVAEGLDVVVPGMSDDQAAQLAKSFDDSLSTRGGLWLLMDLESAESGRTGKQLRWLPGSSIRVTVLFDHHIPAVASAMTAAQGSAAHAADADG